MATILVYNNYTNRMETFQREEEAAMPYNEGNTLTVTDFRGSSQSNFLWTDTSTMDTWNKFRAYWGRPIPVGYAFKRIWEGGHSAMSQHYAGVAFDVGQRLDPATRNELRDSAYTFGGWSYVEPAYLTPTWVHFDKRYGVPACAAGYPTLYFGSVGVYVLILQDALNALGFNGSGLDGYFGARTYGVLQAFQETYGLPSDGIVGCETWKTLTENAVGIGQTPTVVDP